MVQAMTGANMTRVFQLLLFFLMFAHWLGLLWYAIAIAPIEASSLQSPTGEWLWDIPSTYNVATRYVCSLYWALAVMTALKGIDSHETRQCLWTDELIMRPLEERLFTIFTFIFGATSTQSFTATSGSLSAICT